MFFVFVPMLFLVLAFWFALWFLINWARFDNPKISFFTLIKDVGLAILCFWAAAMTASRL